MLDVIWDTALDALKLLPFLFAAYLLMEYVEHRSGDGFANAIRKAGRFGPLIGGFLGIFPQCGFSAACANLYAGSVISAGTLLAVFLSTSDEMLPILISEGTEPLLILKILGMKAFFGIGFGFLIDHAVRKAGKGKTEWSIEKLCEREHCSCEEEEGVLKPALVHTLHVFLFVAAITFLINLGIYFLGEDALKEIAIGKPYFGELIAALIGLIPNCAASVVITQLYLEGLITAGAMISGLLTGAGIGLLVLYRVNDALKENLMLTGILYLSGVAGGMLVEALHLAI